MNQAAETIINNLYRKYQNYDEEKLKYSFDIRYTTFGTKGDTLKARKQVGADAFMRHINALLENFKKVQSITVIDYSGTNPKAVQMNSPVTIELMDVQIPKLLPSEPEPGKQGMDVLQGLAGLFHGTEYEGLGSLAPVAKLIENKYSLAQLSEKNGELSRGVSDWEKKYAVLESKYDSLNREHELLKGEADELEEELEEYRGKDRKSVNLMNMVGLAGASIAKTFLRQHPGILSGLIPADQLRGILNEEPQPEPQASNTSMSPEDQDRLDDATVIFEWLQGLEQPLFDTVTAIFATIRQNPGYADHIIQFLKGNPK